MGLEKILVVNDDAADIIAMQARLPDGIVVIGASQFQARCMDDYTFDLIVLDNDANNREDSKGKETLIKIREKNREVPVIYTSFQPGWVPAEVYQTRGVEVVRTDQALDRIAGKFGVALKDVPEIGGKPKEPQLSLVISYNPIDGYDAGFIRGNGNGDVLVMCFETYAECLAKQVVKGHVDQIYRNFDWKNDRDMIRNVFIYDGINGGQEPGRAAAVLGHDIRMVVNMLACCCDWERKQRNANSTYVNLYEVGCGGREEMGAIVDTILGIKRADTERFLPMPAAKVIQPAERFQM
ncbi:response regulator [Candidatus Woesearchaeota archaeon]|nr:response regulator [Candidatus Woesearchaeota archaeon]